MEKFQKRVVIELNDLIDKIKSLISFVESEDYKLIEIDEQRRLRRQMHIMILYSFVLQERIENF